jgi:hypothetical protein
MMMAVKKIATLMTVVEAIKVNLSSVKRNQKIEDLRAKAGALKAKPMTSVSFTPLELNLTPIGMPAFDAKKIIEDDVSETLSTTDSIATTVASSIDVEPIVEQQEPESVEEPQIEFSESMLQDMLSDILPESENTKPVMVRSPVKMQGQKTAQSLADRSRALLSKTKAVSFIQVASVQDDSRPGNKKVQDLLEQARELKRKSQKYTPLPVNKLQEPDFLLNVAAPADEFDTIKTMRTAADSTSSSATTTASSIDIESPCDAEKPEEETVDKAVSEEIDVQEPARNFDQQSELQDLLSRRFRQDLLSNILQKHQYDMAREAQYGVPVRSTVTNIGETLKSFEEDQFMHNRGVAAQRKRRV